MTRKPDNILSRAVLLRIGAATILWLAASLLNADASNQPPHLVLFLADDHGAADAGCYGNPDVHTPHLDRLATEGVRFERAYCASPSCTPSRSALYTGLMPARNGAHPNHSSVRDGTQSLPHYLAALGYRTVLFGKSHIAPREAFPFEYVSGRIPPAGPDQGSALNTDTLDQFLASHDPQQPLCLIVSSWSPHIPWPANQGYSAAQVELPPGSVDTPESREARTRYYSDVTQLDSRLGSCLESLERHGFSDNLFFVYASDHGAQWPFAKWNLYEAGTRVPLIVRWPGSAQPEQTSHALVSLVDLLPTFIDIAGGKPPSEIDGRSFAPLLTGATDRHREAIFTTHTGDGKMNRSPMRAVRTDRYKYIRNLHPERKYVTHISRGVTRDGRDYWDSWLAKAKNDPAAERAVAAYEKRPDEEFYDLAIDPHEQRNLAAKLPESTKADLRAQLAAWREDQGEIP